MSARVHLGDGAYAQGDGWYLWVETQRNDGMHRVALEPSSILALVRYAVQEMPELAEGIIDAAGGVR